MVALTRGPAQVAKEKKTSEIEKVKSEVYDLNASLKELGDKKESQYLEKNKLEARLNKLISKASELKSKKSDIDRKIRDIKKLREDKNKAVQALIGELHKAKKKHGDGRKSQDKKLDIQKKIRDLEFVVQTEVLSFEKEKKYMNQIRLLKKELGNINKHIESTLEVKKIRDLIKTTKSIADEYHKQIQEASKDGSLIFKELTSISKEISSIKKKRSTLRNTLKSIKTQITQVNDILGKKLGQLGSLPLATGKAMLDGAKFGAGVLHKKTEAVKEKFKKKKKLSKDDILLLQKEAIQKERRNKR